jgi:threonine/homoserine/homoserine lactone efflux protein
MPSLEILITFTLAAFLMNISPGPSNLYVMARSIAQGISGGIAATAGLAVGGLVHVTATVLGLSALFQYSPTLYTAIKLIGAAYLIYLGIQYLLKKSDSQNNSEPDTKLQRKDLNKVFYESVFVEVTNPKTALFFLALLPQFVVPDAAPVSTQLLVLGFIVVVTAIPCDLMVAFFSARMTKYIQENQLAQTIQNKVSGTILAGMGIFIAGEEIVSMSQKQSSLNLDLSSCLLWTKAA